MLSNSEDSVTPLLEQEDFPLPDTPQPTPLFFPIALSPIYRTITNTTNKMLGKLE